MSARELTCKKFGGGRGGLEGDSNNRSVTQGGGGQQNTKQAHHMEYKRSLI